MGSHWKIFPAVRAGRVAFILPSMSESSKKILILGGRGRLAASLALRWSKNNEVSSWGRAEAAASLEVERMEKTGRGAMNCFICERGMPATFVVFSASPASVANSSAFSPYSRQEQEPELQAW